MTRGERAAAFGILGAVVGSTIFGVMAYQAVKHCEDCTIPGRKIVVTGVVFGSLTGGIMGAVTGAATAKKDTAKNRMRQH